MSLEFKIPLRFESEEIHPPGSPALEVSLLGPPEVRWAGRVFTIPRRQTRALLYFLAARPRLISREQLCLLFWGDSPTSIARRNLTHLLNHLRNALPDSEMLLSGEDRVGLDLSRIRTDLVEFERLCAIPDSFRQTQALQEAVRLYRKPFLDGFVMPDSIEFENWVSQQQQVCEREYLEALAALVEASANAGELASAIAYAQRYLETDALAEEIHRRLIELYALSGNRAAALRQYEICMTTMERELGVSPLPETQAVYRAILAGQTPGKARFIRQPWYILPGLDTPLVGREEAVRNLEQAYARARRGNGGVVWVSGEPGIGKTRLVQDFAIRMQGEALVLVGHAFPDIQSTQYQPILQALRPALEDPAITSRIHPALVGEVARLLPELRNWLYDLPSPARVDADQARLRLFEALRQVILALSAESSLVLLCLDNLEWFDPISLDWLAFLAQNLKTSRVLVISTCYSPKAKAIEGLRRRLWRLGLLFEIGLEGLQENDILQLLSYLIGPLVGARNLAGYLLQTTGGNPFFLLESLRQLLESGQLQEGLPDIGDLPVPDTVKQAVESHMELLSPVSRQVLEAGSVLNAPLEFDLLFLTIGCTEVELVDALDELVAHQFLVENGASYHFLHKIFRTVVYHEISAWRRRLIHHRAAQAFLSLHPEDAASLAFHYEKANQPG